MRTNEKLAKKVYSKAIVEKTKGENTNNKEVNWDYLKSINKDIIGWILIQDTKINYPILKDDKNLKYVKTSFDGQYNRNGCIFTINTNPFEDEETIIYGHNMRTDTMFSPLVNYLDERFLNTHKEFMIFTPTYSYRAIIFSVYSIGIADEKNNIKNLEFKDRIKYYKKQSKYNIITDIKSRKIVKLSTCSYLNAKTRPTDQRCYIVAYIF